jgi:hypothetical protein
MVVGPVNRRSKKLSVRKIKQTDSHGGQGVDEMPTDKTCRTNCSWNKHADETSWKIYYNAIRPTKHARNPLNARSRCPE